MGFRQIWTLESIGLAQMMSRTWWQKHEDEAMHRLRSQDVSRGVAGKRAEQSANDKEQPMPKPPAASIEAEKTKECPSQFYSPTKPTMDR